MGITLEVNTSSVEAKLPFELNDNIYYKHFNHKNNCGHVKTEKYVVLFKPIHVHYFARQLHSV